MFTGFLLALREGLEAALILGMVLGALRKLNRMDLTRPVWLGAGLAAGLSLTAALALRALGATLEGTAELAFEGISMWLAAGVLTWMIFWMQRQSRSLRSGIENQVQASTLGGAGALFGLAFTAVIREGIELALFLLAAGQASESAQPFYGALLGLAVAALIGWLGARSAVRLPLSSFFRVTNVLLLLFAAGLAAHGMHEFVEAGWLPALIDPLYNINPLLDENSIGGSLLKALFGYNGNPALIETLVYLAYLAVLGVVLRLQAAPRAAQTA